MWPFRRKLPPQPINKSVAVAKRDFRTALAKAMADAESDGLLLGEIQDILKHQVEMIDQGAAMSVGSRRQYYRTEPTPSTPRVISDDVSRLATLIRGF
jgi:hypothetical protein